MPIYVIALYNNKYIVVASNENEKITVLNNMKDSSIWTIINRPYYVDSCYPDKDEWDLEEMVLKTMLKYGIENVRGGSYQDVELSEVDKMIANRNVSQLARNE